MSLGITVNRCSTRTSESPSNEPALFSFPKHTEKSWHIDIYSDLTKTHWSKTQKLELGEEEDVEDGFTTWKTRQAQHSSRKSRRKTTMDRTGPLCCWSFFKAWHDMTVVPVTIWSYEAMRLLYWQDQLDCSGCTFYRPDALPFAWSTVSNHWRHATINYKRATFVFFYNKHRGMTTLPSMGFPRASTTRPSSSRPTGTSTIAPVRFTMSPSLISLSLPKTTIPTLSGSKFNAIPCIQTTVWLSTHTQMIFV